MFKIQVIEGKASLAFECDKAEFSGVKKVAGMVMKDVQRVFGFDPELIEDDGKTEPEAPVVVFGTIGKSAFVEELEKAGKIDLSKVRGKRESYGFFVLDNALVIAGSDKRGTVYGLFHLSELLGVSPLVDWADVLPVHKDSFELTDSDNYISKEPSVRFRGFFINDEWPATGNWCNHNFGGFNTKMYEHVFELLLRMKGNYLWPAMWSARFSDDGPGLGNAELADELGVIMGASHHEPCCRYGEEYRHVRGPESVYGDAWNFRSNEKGITKFWEDGLKRSGKFENVITVGMRGEADTAIMKNATLKDNIDLLRDVLKTQNNLIKQYVNPDVQQVPRMLALYKEVEPYFYGDKHTKGLMDSPELEGVTLMLCDDNHGNLRTVPTEKMRSHKGGYGMYYHFDYHGSPYSFEWINTTALPKVKEQMTAAYDFGIKDLWIVNVGDVMTNEFPLSYFLDLAYDYEKYSAEEYTTEKWTEEWVRSQFPSLTEEQIADVNYILNNYTKLAHQRRTECIEPLTYHPVNFGEGDRMLEAAQAVIDKAEGLRCLSDKPEFTGLFAQVIYPALGTMNVLRMQLFSGKNKWFAQHGAMAANWYAKKVKECYDFDQKLVDEYDEIANGKFYAEGWSEHFGFKNWCEAESHYPTYTYVEPTRKGRCLFWIEGSEQVTSGQDWTNRVLKYNGFKNPDTTQFKLNIANCGKTGTPYTVSFENEKTPADLFLEAKIEKHEACDENGVSQIDEVVVTIDREKLLRALVKKDTLIVEANDGHGAGIKVFVEIDAEIVKTDYEAGTFVQTGDYVSINPAKYSSAHAGFRKIKNYGKTDCAVKYFPVTESFEKVQNAPSIEYNVVLSGSGNYSFDFYLNPSNPAYKDNLMQFAVSIGGKTTVIDVVNEKFVVGDNQEPWSTDVTNNIRIKTVTERVFAGVNKIKFYPLTPGIVLEKIVIHAEEFKMPESYLGAPDTYVVK